MNIPLEIWKFEIFPKLDLLSQLRLRATCKYLYTNLDITDLYNIDIEYRGKLTNEILLQYPKLEKLDTRDNSKITNISYLKNLKILDASWYSGINDESLIGLDLIKLNVWGNPNITKISHLKNLKKLDAGYDSGINDESLIGLDLVELCATSNPKITKISHLKNLKILIVEGSHSGINDESLIGLDLIELNSWWNDKISYYIKNGIKILKKKNLKNKYYNSFIIKLIIHQIKWSIHIYRYWRQFKFSSQPFHKILLVLLAVC